ncbi:MAG: hypothetical protein M3O15_15535, partial [Acidobacteriota bacterium]|nr:hypothetical protein [Acidobacteriota bacterium]
SVQIVPSHFFKWEIDAEYFNKGFGGSTRSSVSPQAYLLLGNAIYAGLGVGTTYSSDFKNSFSSPFYAARAGLDLVLLPRFHLDINGNYRFHAFHELHNVSTGTVTLGAVARIAL